jgi:peptidyl-prolyl cis-trans isomerase C
MKRFGSFSRSLSLCAMLTLSTARSAEDPRRQTAVLTQGATVITVADIEDALAKVPMFQLTSMGGSALEIQKTFLEDMFTRNVLLAKAAEKNGLANDPLIAVQMKRALGNATMRQTSKGVLIEDAQVASYYAAHASEFAQEERILVWRILVATREEALTLLKLLKADGTVKAFTEAAREKSLDKASYLRSGNLGFLMPDGTSVEAKLKMDLNLVKAAQKVRDGEIVQEPVQEGEAFAIVWRRGSTQKTMQTAEEASRTIRENLLRLAREQARSDFLAKLRKDKVTDYETAPLSAFEVELGNGSIFVSKKPAATKP